MIPEYSCSNELMIKQWNAISDEKYVQIWNQIRDALNPGRTDNTQDILDGLSPDEAEALFHRLCCDYGFSTRFGKESKRNEKLLIEFEKTLDLLHDRHQEKHPRR